MSFTFKHLNHMTDYKKEKYFTIPNILSFYRLASFPFVLVIALQGHEGLFAILLVINLVTDILDGLIARIFNQQTEIGAKLDSLADEGTYILAFLGIYLFKWDLIRPHTAVLFLFIGLYISTIIFSLIKFRRFPSLHLYSAKIGGYLQGFFFCALFLFGFYAWLYYIAMLWGIMAFAEDLCILALLPEMRSDTKGLFWHLKGKEGQK